MKSDHGSGSGGNDLAQRDLAQRTPEDFVLEIAPVSSSIATTRLFAASVVRHFGYPDEIVEDVKIAISETVTNAVKAHSSIDSTELITLRVHTEGERITFEVVDRGPGFDFSPAPPTVQPTVLRMGSLGLALVRSLFPNTDVRRNEDRGMTIEFSLDPASLDPASQQRP